MVGIIKTSDLRVETKLAKGLFTFCFDDDINIFILQQQRRRTKSGASRKEMCLSFGAFGWKKCVLFLLEVCIDVKFLLGATNSTVQVAPPVEILPQLQCGIRGLWRRSGRKTCRAFVTSMCERISLTAHFSLQLLLCQ